MGRRAPGIAGRGKLPICARPEKRVLANILDTKLMSETGPPYTIQPVSIHEMPFGQHGATATFQQLMNLVLQPHDQYVAAYIDDIVIYSNSWKDYLQHLSNLLRALRMLGSQQAWPNVRQKDIPRVHDRRRETAAPSR